MIRGEVLSPLKPSPVSKPIYTCIYEFRSVLTMVLLNGPPLSNFVDRGLGEWESGSGWGLGVPKMVLLNGTLCNTPKNLPTLVLASSLFPHLLNYPPFLSSVPLSHTLTAPMGDFTVAFDHEHSLV
jgi:hypothetical protein